MTQPCPRQAREAVMEAQKRHVSHWRKDRTCSYCGSIKPEDFIRAVELGEEITPTDKNYKAYVGNQKFYFQHLNDTEQAEFISLFNKSKFKFAYPGYFYVMPFFCVKV